MLNEEEFNVDDSFNLDEFFDAPVKTKSKVSVGENQLLLPNGKLITFNEQQTEALKRIKEWLKSDKQFFTISGHAGTGKTTIIKKVLDEYRYGVVVSAPTHKAKGVIGNTTGRDAKTLHSLLGLRPDVDLDNFSPNFPQFNPIALPKIDQYNWCIIDESSMINKELFDLIKKTVKGCKVKVLFMGDICQIPPIGEKLSVVFNHPEIEMYELTKVERQNDGNPLLLLYDNLRNNINRVNGGFERKSSLNKLGEGMLFTVDKKEFRNIMLETYRSEEFNKNSDFCKTIAWKNNTVMQSNKIISLLVCV